MAQCEMCGQDKELVTAAVEGVDLNVCSGCAQYGVVRFQQKNSHFSSSSSSSSSRQSVSAPRAEEIVVSTLASLLRRAREKRQLTQEDFAKLLQERESIVAKWEQGSAKPSVAEAKKIGRLLSLTLVEKEDLSSVSLASTSSKNAEPTLGDFVKIRKRNVV